MKFSDLFGRSGQPAQTAFYSAPGIYTVTSSPATLVGVSQPLNHPENQGVRVTVSSGGNNIFVGQSINFSYYGFWSVEFTPTFGIDCPDGITVNVSQESAEAVVATSIFYILK